jgi:hypothetical protein
MGLFNSMKSLGDEHQKIIKTPCLIKIIVQQGIETATAPAEAQAHSTANMQA